MLFSENGLLKAHFLLKVTLNRLIWYLYWPAWTNFASNVARKQKRVAHPRTKRIRITMLNIFQ